MTPRDFDVHPRTLEASAACKRRGSCHDCAMTCPYGNQVEDSRGDVFPCGTEVFNDHGDILLCGDCAVDQLNRYKEENRGSN